jgi:hypothetical protein
MRLLREFTDMLTFEIDSERPYSVLEDCAGQIEMFSELMSLGGTEGIAISDMSCAAMCNTLRAISGTIQHVHDLLFQQASDASLVAACRQADQRAAPVPSTVDIASVVDELIAARPELFAPRGEKQYSARSADRMAGDLQPVAPRLTKPKRSDGERRAAA